jgi:hypothetical protein
MSVPGYEFHCESIATHGGVMTVVLEHESVVLTITESSTSPPYNSFVVGQNYDLIIKPLEANSPPPAADTFRVVTETAQTLDLQSLRGATTIDWSGPGAPPLPATDITYAVSFQHVTIS